MSHKLSQARAARRIDHRGPQSWSAWETARVRPTRDNVEKIARAYGVDVSWLDPCGEAYDPDAERGPRVIIAPSHRALLTDGNRSATNPPTTPSTEEGDGLDLLIEVLRGLSTQQRTEVLRYAIKVEEQAKNAQAAGDQ